MKVASIGDNMFIKMFELIGAVGYKAEDEEELKKILAQLIKEKKYAIIVLPERYVEATREIREKLAREGEYFPLFAFLPDHTGIKDRRIEELKRLISLAVGVELKL
mgnify:CR=1 FL=1